MARELVLPTDDENEDDNARGGGHDGRRRIVHDRPLRRPPR